MERVSLVRITPLRSLIILYRHEVSSYRDFTAATRSIVPPRRGYRGGKIVASVSHRYDTVNSSGEYSLEEISTRLPLPLVRDVPDESPRKTVHHYYLSLHLHSAVRDRIDEVLKVCRRCRHSCHRYISRPLVLRAQKTQRISVMCKYLNFPRYLLEEG